MTETERPLVTLVLFAYNQEQFIREAVESVLGQDYSPLEIIISDDCSSDQTFLILESLVTQYAGPHSIRVRRNVHNLGLASHINQINELASGELVVASAGDDISYPGRVSRIVETWLASGKRECSIFSSMDEIDLKSLKTGKQFRSPVLWDEIKPYQMIKRNMGVFGAAHAWSVLVPRFFPPMFSEIINEDAVIPFRSVLRGGVIYIDEVLVSYRANNGLASQYSGGVRPTRLHARQPSLLRRPYVVSMQRIADLKFADDANLHLMALAKSRRADYLFRWWLTSGGSWTMNRILYFARRCRPAWIVRELWLLGVERISMSK